MKKRKKTILIIAIIGLLILLCGVRSCSCYKGNGPGIADGENIDVPDNPSMDTLEELIEIPGIDKTIITDDSPYLYLVNPERNSVYFRYLVRLNETILYETESIPPGKMIKVNGYDILKQGSYDLVFEITTFDLETGKENNGATLTALISVK